MSKAPLTLDSCIGHHGTIIKYYRRQVMNPPRGWTQEQLAEAAGISVRWVQGMERQPFIQSMTRRKALAVILGIPAALLNLEEGVLISRRGRTPLQEWMIDSLEDGTRSRWHLYYTSSSAVTEEGLLKQIETLEQLADERSGDQRRLYRVLAQNYQLAGSLARDQFHYGMAKKYFREAQRLAEEGQSVDLAAAAVARQGLALLRQERVSEAVEIYAASAGLAKPAQAQIKAYVYAGYAEALARTKQSRECYYFLDQAQHLLEHSSLVPQEDLAYVHLTPQSVADTSGECAVLLGEPRRGLEYLQAAFKQLDPTMSRRRCRLFFQQAEAHLAAGHLDRGISYALKGLQLAQALQSYESTNWAAEIHARLKESRWRYEPLVGELGAAIVEAS